MSAKIEVEYKIEIEPEDTSVRGSFALGDDEADLALENEIIAKLDRGDLWAWCMVKVTATAIFEGHKFSGVDYLGACSYASEADFCAGGYFADMKQAALHDLKANVREATTIGYAAVRALTALESL